MKNCGYANTIRFYLILPRSYCPSLSYSTLFISSIAPCGMVRLCFLLLSFFWTNLRGTGNTALFLPVSVYVSLSMSLCLCLCLCLSVCLSVCLSPSLSLSLVLPLFLMNRWMPSLVFLSNYGCSGTDGVAYGTIVSDCKAVIVQFSVKPLTWIHPTTLIIPLLLHTKEEE